MLDVQNCLLTAVINSLSDWIILLLPLWAIQRLNLPLSGLFACMASICRLVYTVRIFYSDDSSYAVQQMEMWT